MDLVCAACGARGTGKFCSGCGAALGGGYCSGCGAPLAAGVRFCTTCGVPQVGRPLPTPAGNRFPVIPIAIAAVAVIALVVVLIQRGEPAAAPQGAVAPFADGAGGTPPDLSSMTPREQFDRLYDRVMRAAEQGDTATVNGFSPMALQAYRNLESVDADARYDIAMIRLHTGDIAGARALADSILADQPDHLFGYVLQAALARFEGDDVQLQEIYRRFLGAWDKEMAAKRPEYSAHQTTLDRFEQTARAPSGR